MTDTPAPHPESAALQAYAADELGPDELRPVADHLASCARCRSETEAWSVLFGQLDELSDLTPSSNFGDQVMARISTPSRVETAATTPDRNPGWFDRALQAVSRWFPVRSDSGRSRPHRGSPGHDNPADRSLPLAGGHLRPAGLQDWLEGSLSPAVSRRVEAHLDHCTTCRREVDAWTPIMARLDALGHLPTPAGLGSAVMSRVDVHAVAERARVRNRSFVRRATAFVRRLVPSTWTGWLVAGGIGAVPTAAAAAATAAVIAHPLLTPGGLITMARWQLTDWAVSVGQSTLGPLAAFAGGLVVEAVQAAALAPTPVLAGFVIFSTGALASSWVLYRYILAPSLPAFRHVQRS